jgi:ABC-type phosphate transport system ATPase subunit
MSITIETRKTQNHLLISIPTDEISAEEIEELISFLKTEFIVRKSEMTTEQAEEISEEIKSDWWNKHGSRIKNLVAENE